jgi:hypothetical protein
MKITDHDLIKSSEQELIDNISADLDWDAIENIFMEEHRLPIGEDVAYQNGDIVVYDNQIAYQLNFDVKVPLSILVDREGNHLAVRSSQEFQAEGENRAEMPGHGPSEPPVLHSEGADTETAERQSGPIYEDVVTTLAADGTGQPDQDEKAEMDFRESPDRRIERMASEAKKASSDIQ